MAEDGGGGNKSEMARISVDKADEKMLLEFNFYHAFLPREDLAYLLKKAGDYLIRISEVDTTKEGQAHVKREIVLSVMGEPLEGAETDMTEAPKTTVAAAKAKIKNVVIMRSADKPFYIEPQKHFATIKEMVEYYEKNCCTLTKVKFMLKSGIGQQSWEHYHKSVVLGKVLGEGAYGEVRAGTLQIRKKVVEVAVKMTKGTDDLCKAQIKELMREARLMRHFKHPNIVRLYGVSVDEQPIYILLELVKGGSLVGHLQKFNVALDEKLLMALGAAQGVEYLHTNNCIHRDLAARNCLYHENKTVKISDFGLSRSCTTYTVKGKEKLPIKWLAPEAIKTMTFSVKTDVYTFGVLLYEIFADGAEPWEKSTNIETARSVLSGKPVELPPSCPEKLKTFLKERVFLLDPDKRCNMSEVVRAVSILLEDDHKIPQMSKSLMTPESSSTRSTETEASKKSKRSALQKRSLIKGFHNRSNNDDTNTQTTMRSELDDSAKKKKTPFKKGFHRH